MPTSDELIELADECAEQLQLDGPLRHIPSFSDAEDQCEEEYEALLQAIHEDELFAPELGIVEDPATGSASGPLGCYLVHHGLVRGDAARQIVNLQGVAMGRPSRIHIAIGGHAGAIVEVKVGGTAVLVGRGEILI